MNKDTGLLIWSGGLDSTTLLFNLIRAGRKMHTVHFAYGSKHNAKEAGAVAAMSRKFKIPVTFIELDWMARHFKSNLLTSGGEIPEGHYEDESMAQTVVPFRNGILLSIAAGLAESMDIKNVYYGAHAGDHAIYPDCRKGFIDQMYFAINYGTSNQVQLFAPFKNMNKGDIVKAAHLVGAPLELTYTCYKGMAYHCGKCGACVERKEAFQTTGVPDPTWYGPVVLDSKDQKISAGGIAGAEQFGQG